MSLAADSVAVVTGAASGIGRALAVRLAQEGIGGLALSDVNAAGLAETAQLVQQTAPQLRCTTHQVNVADRQAVVAFAAEVEAAHGRVTHLVNNAGVGLLGSVEEVSLEEIEWLMSVNFWGVVYGTKIFLPALRRAPYGHIINISSVFGFVAPLGQAAYCASKFAVRGFTESLRHELANSTIKVSCVHPGGIKTNIANNSRFSQGLKNAPCYRSEIQRFNDTLARTTPAQAAETIVRGIKRGKARILIGSDARIISLLYRLLPTRYGGIFHYFAGLKPMD